MVVAPFQFYSRHGDIHQSRTGLSRPPRSFSSSAERMPPPTGTDARARRDCLGVTLGRELLRTVATPQRCPAPPPTYCFVDTVGRAGTKRLHRSALRAPSMGILPERSDRPIRRKPEIHCACLSFGLNAPSEGEARKPRDRAGGMRCCTAIKKPGLAGFFAYEQVLLGARGAGGA